MRRHELGESPETFEPPWYPVACINTFDLSEAGGKSTVTQTLRYESNAAREAVIQSPMERGVAISYNRLEEMLASSNFAAAQK